MKPFPFLRLWFVVAPLIFSSPIFSQCVLEVNHTVDGLTVTVNAVGSGAVQGIGQISWGDPAFSVTEGLSGTFTYPDLGFYVIDIVYYDALNPFDCVATEFIQIDFTVPCSVTASITVNGNEVTVVAQGNGAQTEEYFVNWDDGILEPGNDLLHLYGADGVYDVCITYTDPNNPKACSAQYCEEVQVCTTPLEVSFEVGMLGKGVTVNASGTGAFNPNYIIFWGDGSFTEGNAGGHVYDAEGTYTLCVQYADGVSECFVQECEELVVSSVAETPEAFVSLTAAPNPVKERLTVNLTPSKAGPVVVRLLDLSGRSVQTLYSGSAGWKGLQFSADVSALPAGCYLLEVAGEAGKRTQRVIVQ